MKMKYKLIEIESSSSKYGNCEICKKPVSDMWLQVVKHESSYGGLVYGNSTFGHKKCLLEIRR